MSLGSGVMAHPHIINDARHWRARAEEMRLVAEEMRDPGNRQTALGLLMTTTVSRDVPRSGRADCRNRLAVQGTLPGDETDSRHGRSNSTLGCAGSSNGNQAAGRK